MGSVVTRHQEIEFTTLESFCCKKPLMGSETDHVHQPSLLRGPHRREGAAISSDALPFLFVLHVVERYHINVICSEVAQVVLKLFLSGFSVPRFQLNGDHHIAAD